MAAGEIAGGHVVLLRAGKGRPRQDEGGSGGKGSSPSQKGGHTSNTRVGVQSGSQPSPPISLPSSQSSSESRCLSPHRGAGVVVVVDVVVVVVVVVLVDPDVSRQP